MEKLKMYILNNKRIVILCILAFSVLVIIGCYLYYNSFLDSNIVSDVTLNELEVDELVIDNNESLSDSESTINEVLEYIFVDVKGYVNKPGVYKFLKNDDKRVYDLIDLAGGLKKDADTSIINMSLKLYDEMVVIVYSKKEINDFLATKKKLEEKIEICQKDEVINNGCINNGDINVDKNNNVNSENDSMSSNSVKKININTATKSELTTLTGVGDSKADAIINYRSEVGKFNKIEDIMNVDGIGESVFEKIKNNITVE